MSYFCQKSCVEIWFGLVEIRGMLILKGAEGPLVKGVTCDLRCPFLNLAEVVQIKVMSENLVQIC